MANFELKMPKMGESITEATITRWLKNVGDMIELDEPILEIATDKVDSEIPSPVEGVLIKQLFKEGDVVEVEAIIAIIDMDADGSVEPADNDAASAFDGKPSEADQEATAQASAGKSGQGSARKSAGEVSSGKSVESAAGEMVAATPGDKAVEPVEDDGRFYSPLVRSIAREEGISMQEMASVKGSGQGGRVTKADLMEYLKSRMVPAGKPAESVRQETRPAPAPSPVMTPEVVAGSGDEVIAMDRMRKLIAEHMVMSEATSVHITLFTEVDMTNLVKWRNKQKDILLKRENEKLTFTPIFIETIAKALRDFPMVNISVDGDKIIKRKNINIGMAAALPNGNLIVPVIKNADHKSLLGLAKEVNDLANRARQNQLKPDEIQGGTFTLTNFGTFGATSGTPIINQPQVAILGVGLIEKKPAVVETPHGDAIAIRHRMILSLSCDHRVVDGGLGSQFMRRVAEYLENFDTNQNI